MRTGLLLLAVAVGGGATAEAATLRVGPTRTLTTPSAAAAVAGDGDTVLIDAGTYTGDVATWRQDRLILRGVGGRVKLPAAGRSAQGKATWVVAGDRTTVENVEFTGSVVLDGNGAGIRQEGADLVVRNCVFRGNQDGILTGANAASDILIEFSTFDANGGGDGFTHNIYVGAVRSFTLRFSVVKNARVGHEVKSRALRNDIRYNVIDDGSATASFSVDLPNAGESRLVGNLIVQGAASENEAFVSYGLEGLANPDRRLWLAHNTFVNRRDGGRVVQAPAGATVTGLNNTLAGTATWVQGGARAVMRGNARVAPGRARPVRGSKLVNRAVAVPRALVPRFEPVGVARRARPGVGRRDIGAFELR